MVVEFEKRIHVDSKLSDMGSSRYVGAVKREEKRLLFFPKYYGLTFFGTGARERNVVDKRV